MDSLDFLDATSNVLSFDGTLTVFEGYSLPSLITLAKAVVQSALYRKESRGAHLRSDYPNENDEYKHPTYASYKDGKIFVGGDINEI